MTEFILHRHKDPSQVSGVGAVAWGVEWPDGAVAVRWHGEYPSTAAWEDIRGVEAIHGHGGLTVVEYAEPDRLLVGYQRVTPFLLSGLRNPQTISPHPSHPDRLLLAFKDENVWRFWVGLLEGSTYAATHEQLAGQLVTTWVTPDGNVWLQWSRRGTYEDLLDGETYDEDPLTTFDREDRG